MATSRHCAHQPTIKNWFHEFTREGIRAMSNAVKAPTFLFHLNSLAN